MRYNRLFSPITIRGMELKNRVVMPAMDTLLTENGFATTRYNEFLWARAAGGVGLITAGGAVIDDYGSSYDMMHLDADEYIAGYKEMTDGIHARGAKAAVQLFHAGRYAAPQYNEGRQPIAPTEMYSGYSRATSREMTVEEIHTVEKKFAAAALRAKIAGFDMVEISGSAGYLICQFLSPFTNHRTDDYGGSWENRLRFPQEVVQAVRAAVGESYPIGMRIAGNDLVPGSNTEADAVRFAQAMEAAGVDVLNVTGGWHESQVPQITGALPRGGFDFLGAAIKDAVSIPVIVSNRINAPGTAERILALGDADLVSLGRPHIADPDWCRKVEAGHPELVRKCLGCNQGCLAKVFFNEPIQCLVNPEAGREFEHPPVSETTKPSRKILVLGAGPTGMEFAIRASEYGHAVTVWEASRRIGGQLHLAALPPDKEEFRSLIAWFETMQKEKKITVEFGRKAAPNLVKQAVAKEGFDLVVIAVGRGMAKSLPMAIPQNLPVYTAEEVLTGEVMVGRHPLVLGGGTVGCETAQYLAVEAAASPQQVYHMLKYGYESPERVQELLNTCRREIALVDMKKIGAGFEPGTSWPLLSDMKRFGVRKYPFTELKEFTPDGMAVLEVRDRKEPAVVTEERIPVSDVVVALGAEPNDGLWEALKGERIDVYSIGDAGKLGNALSAIRQGYDLAEALFRRKSK